jgi:hypothetical protein
MESGQRKDAEGKIVPAKSSNGSQAEYNGKPVFSADWHPSISANPVPVVLPARARRAVAWRWAWTG